MTTVNTCSSHSSIDSKLRAALEALQNNANENGPLFSETINNGITFRRLPSAAELLS